MIEMGGEKYACGRKEKPNQLITDPNTQREKEMGEIKVENILKHKEERRITDKGEIFFGFLGCMFIR